MPTIPEFLFDQVDRVPERPAITAWIDGGWATRCWADFAADVNRAAFRLHSAGIEPGQRVLLIAANRYAWPVADLALQCLGAVSVPLSPLLTSAQIGELAEHCGAALALVDDVAPRAASATLAQKNVPVWPLRDVLEIAPGSPSSSGHDFCHAISRKRVSPETLLSILYTSGTTGAPKGVMLTQGNLASNALAKTAALPLFAEDRRLCWLPMAHIFARLADLCTAWLTGCHTVISRGREHLFDELRSFQPTYINGVPWLFEKCWRLAGAQGQSERPGTLREMLGGKIRVCNCGGAPLAPHVADWFRAQDVPLVCGYGLTEASPVVTACTVDEHRPGAVGKALPGVELRVAADGEVELRGPNVMQGYYREPEATARTVVDGWLRTGDLGKLDGDGFLTITGRKKDLIITSTGRNIAPALIETRLLSDAWVSQCLVVGDGLPFPLAIVVPDPAAIPAGLEEDQALADRLRVRFDELLTDRPRWERPAGVVVVRSPFTVENGLATPKQSLRRSLIVAALADRIGAEVERLRKNRLEREPA